MESDETEIWREKVMCAAGSQCWAGGGGRGQAARTGIPTSRLQSPTLQTGLSGIETSQNNKGPYFAIPYASPVHMKGESVL